MGTKFSGHYFLELLSKLCALKFLYNHFKIKISNIKRIRNQIKALQTQPTQSFELQKVKQVELQKQSVTLLKNEIIFGNTCQEVDLQLNDNFKNYLVIKTAIPKNKLIFQPYFSLMDSNQNKVYINLNNKTIFDKKLYQKIESEQKLSIKKSFSLFNVDKLFRVQLKDNVIAFGGSMYVLGDFIFNKENNILRCYASKFLGTKQSLIQYLKRQLNQNFFILAYISIASIGLLVNLIQMHKNNNSRLKRINIKSVEISKGNNQIMCQNCKINSINLIFSPCYHFNYCWNCGEKQIKCSACGEEIIDYIRVFKN